MTTGLPSLLVLIRRGPLQSAGQTDPCEVAAGAEVKEGTPPPTETAA